MTFNYRCTTKYCRTRKTLRRRIEDYIRVPKCKVCNGTLKHDPSVKKRSSRLVCRCDGYPFPHRQGTEPWCHSAKIGPSDEDWEEMYKYGHL